LGTLFLDKSIIISYNDSSESIKKCGQPYAIEISVDNNVTAGGKSVLFFAANENDHSEWVRAINLAKNNSVNRTNRTNNSNK